MIVTNDGDKPINLEQARIHLILANGDQIPAAEAEDVERRAASPQESYRAGDELPIRRLAIESSPKTPRLMPTSGILNTKRSSSRPTPPARASLFYDVEGLSDPLKGSKLYLRRLQAADGKNLFYFEIPFDKYLAASTKPGRHSAAPFVAGSQTNLWICGFSRASRPYDEHPFDQHPRVKELQFSAVYRIGEEFW